MNSFPKKMNIALVAVTSCRKKSLKERGLTDLAVFCEEAIEAMGINPVLARVGYEGWKFYKGSSEIRMFVYDRSYLFATSPLNILPKKNLEPVLTYLLQTRDCSLSFRTGWKSDLSFLSCAYI